MDFSRGMCCGMRVLYLEPGLKRKAAAWVEQMVLTLLSAPPPSSHRAARPVPLTGLYKGDRHVLHPSVRNRPSSRVSDLRGEQQSQGSVVKEYIKALEERVEKLEGILHKVANRERELSRLAETAHDATRAVNDGFTCGAFVELIDWYTFDED